MRTTLDLPEKLLNDAMKITHTGTKIGVIVLALKSKGSVSIDNVICH